MSVLAPTPVDHSPWRLARYRWYRAASLSRMRTPSTRWVNSAHLQREHWTGRRLCRRVDLDLAACAGRSCPCWIRWWRLGHHDQFPRPRWKIESRSDDWHPCLWQRPGNQIIICNVSTKPSIYHYCIKLVKTIFKKISFFRCMWF